MGIKHYSKAGNLEVEQQEAWSLVESLVCHHMYTRTQQQVSPSTWAQVHQHKAEVLAETERSRESLWRINLNLIAQVSQDLQ